MTKRRLRESHIWSREKSIQLFPYEPLAGAVVGLVLLDRSADFSVWRLLVGSAAVLAGVFLALRLGIPESPRWLIEHGRTAEAKTIIARLAPNTDLEAEGLKRQFVPQTRASSAPASKQSNGVSLLFSRQYRPRILLVAAPWFLMDIATYGVGMFTPVILGAMNFGAHASAPVAGDFADTQGSGAIDVFLLIGFLVGLWAVPIHLKCND